MMLIRSLAAIATALLASAAFAAPDALLPPGASLNSKTPEQLSVEWWQWAKAANAVPLRDSTGADCGVGQSGPVWFLAGSLGTSKIKRVCVVPEGKSLFFPVVNIFQGQVPGGQSMTCEDVKDAVSLTDENEVDLFLEIDGVRVSGVTRYRVATQRCFDVMAKVPKGQRDRVGYPSASDGYWVGLKPLTKGRHTLKFGARFNRNADAYGKALQDIEYELQVQ